MSIENLKLLMDSKLLNNTEAARLIGVEPGTVGAWLKGSRKVSRKYAEKVSELLGDTRAIPKGDETDPIYDFVHTNIFRIAATYGNPEEALFETSTFVTKLIKCMNRDIK